MKLVSFQHGGRDGFGVVKGNGVVDMSAAFFFETRYADLREVFAAGAVDELARAVGDEEPDLGLTDISFLLPISRPAKILCAGRNYYADEGEKKAGKRPDYPSIFARYSDSVVPHGEPIIKPKESDQLDYEGELAVVIGKQGRHIAEDDALGHIGGYTCVNEGSVRDWQTQGAQNFPGKNFRHSGSIGPWIVTADEIADPGQLEITTRVNGEVRQNATTGLMIFSIPFLISYISKFIQLEPGDIISTGSPTGTPGGAAFEDSDHVWLKAGDRLEVEISGIGTLENPIAAE